MKRRHGFLAELRRRNVIRMGGLYLVGAWLVVQVADTVLPMFGAPEWMPRSIVALLAIGFLPALIFAWVFELTPEGLKRDDDVPAEASIAARTGRRMEHMIVALLLVAVAYFAVDKFVLMPERAAVAEATRASAVAEPGIAERSIAVMPFANTSGDPANEYFSDGLSEEMIVTLGKLRDLKVIGRNSSFQFKGKSEDSRTVGARLGVAYLLEGSVRKAGAQVRIAVQLIRASDGSDVWSQSYDRELEDIFAVQSEIATVVAQKLQSTLLGDGRGQALRTDAPPGGDTGAYNELLQGNFYYSRGTEADLRTAIDHYQRAVDRDPRYASAYARMARARAILWARYIGSLEPGEAESLPVAAKEAATRALQLDPRSAQAHLAQATVLDYEGDFQASEAGYRRAVALAPQDAEAIRRLAMLQVTLGHAESGLEGLARAIRLDPLSAAAWSNQGLLFVALGRHRDAEASLRKAIELQPGFPVAHAMLGLALSLQGSAAEAVAAADREPDPFWRTFGLAMVHEANGDRAASERYLQQLIAAHADDSPMQIAQVYALRKQPDEMFRWLDHALAVGDGGLTEMRLTPFVVDYADDSRFVALARKVGVMPEQDPPTATSTKASP